MSEENVEITRRILEAYGRGEEVPELFQHDVVWHPAEETPTQGIEAVRAYLRRWESEWEELSAIPEEFVDAGDKVMVTVHFSGRGRGVGSRSMPSCTRSTPSGKARLPGWTSS